MNRAFSDTNCQSCGNFMAQGQPLYIHEEEKLCDECAEAKGLVCKCGDQKKPHFDECYGCHMKKST